MTQAKPEEVRQDAIAHSAVRWPARWRGVLITWAVATALGVALAGQAVLATSSFGRPIPWSVALSHSLREMWTWAALTPAIFAVARRFPVLGKRRTWNLGAHLAAGLAVAGLFTVVNFALVEWLTPDEWRPTMFSERRRPRPAEAPPTEGRPPDGPPRRERDSRPFEPPSPSRRLWVGYSSRLFVNLSTYAMLAAIWHWLDHQRRLRERERQTQELSRQLADARLQALRMQLNPHFLFNTLNAIATLLHRDPRAADEMIACLSDFLRLTLGTAGGPETALRSELEFAHRYLDIEKVRFGDRLTVVEDIGPACLDAAVPTLVLQPLLENAVRHGIERSEGPGEVRLEARRDNRRLILRVIDSGPGLPETPSSRVGVGLTNTRARLRELYGDDGRLALNNRPEGGLDAEVQLPWRVMVATNSAPAVASFPTA